jgi:hypothetical protein
MDISLRAGGNTMKRTALILLMILGLATWSFAGKITGTITEGGKPLAKGVKLDVTCGSTTRSAETDANGGYSVVVPEEGKCTLKMNYQGQTPTFEVTSYEGTVQYDLIMEKQADGKYTLKRK